MKLNRFFSAAVSAALLISLCACNQSGPGPAGDNPSASVGASALPSSTQETPGPSVLPPEGSTAPGPSPSASAEQFDENYRLDVAIPELIDGLELPVSGATGYTSVALPLWPSLPDRPSTTPEPTFSPSPSPSPSPAPSPSPSQAGPDPTESVTVTNSPEPSPGESETVTGSPEPSPGESETVTGSPEPSPSESETGSGSPEPEPTGSDELTPIQNPDSPARTSADPNPAPEQPPVISAADSLPASDRAVAPLSAGVDNPYAGALTVWEPGTAFVILEEDGDWWRVSRGRVTGWIEHRYCMINLPDVIPSIIYDDINAYSCIFVSSGKNIPGITGETFYHSLVYNIRLDRQEFVMPILYSAARNICAAQHRALAEGNCLKVYQTFRPYDTQTAVANAVAQLANVDPEVRAGISTPPWSIDWFIAVGVSNHQRGYALDASMVKVSQAEIKYAGYHPYLYAVSYADYEMPTAMHELSIAAITTVSPDSSQLSETMTRPAIALRGYFTDSGLSPLASEWWHFNDLAAMEAASANPSDGKYYVTECLSRLPE